MDILAAICLLGAAPAQKTVEFSTTLGGDAPTQLAQVMEYFITLQIAHRMEVALFFRDAHNLPPDKSREIDKSRMAFHKMLCSILDEGKKAGDFHFDNVSLTASALGGMRSEEHTSELQSLMRISYAVFCLKKRKKIIKIDC